jgi:hypothetical protein
MSYDLYFRSPTQLTIEQLSEYFIDQPNFSVTEQRAHYENEVTGVYFGFDFESEPEEGHAPLAFNMNYFRPHIFGLEAEPVVTAFVEHFELGVDDPQTSGIEDGSYSAEGFLRGWNAGNELGYRSFMSEESPPPPLTMPSARLEGVWRWNMAKDRAADHILDLIGDAPPCFVPTVMLFQTGETEVQSLVVWDGEMVVAIPDVDLVLMTETGEPIVAPTKDLLGMLTVHSEWKSDYEVGGGLRVGLRTWLIDTVSPATTAKLRKAMRPFEPVGRPSLDQVLDAELVAAARAKR